MKMNSLIITLLIFCIVSCDKLVDHAYIIEIDNNSNDIVWCYASYNYPDTSLAVNKPLLQMITPKSYTKLASKKEWKDVLPKDTILIYIFNKDSIATYSWDVIRTKNKVLKMYTLSIQDLEKQSWIVAYP